MGMFDAKRLAVPADELPVAVEASVGGLARLPVDAQRPGGGNELAARLHDQDEFSHRSLLNADWIRRPAAVSLRLGKATPHVVRSLGSVEAGTRNGGELEFVYVREIVSSYEKTGQAPHDSAPPGLAGRRRDVVHHSPAVPVRRP
jgi:hypothetical protein